MRENKSDLTTTQAFLCQHTEIYIYGPNRHFYNKESSTFATYDSVNSSLQVKKGGSKYQEIATCNHADILHFLCRGIINLLIYFLIHYQDTAVEG